ncbi:hypothetical protein CCMSSC00406_0001067 [Pleurotus cornucopiae]|uniref:Uncharacterized protein n=1 Tax=Pleurotus cornucopiae TaxID=5321 RepID=A0ACB7IKY6_PLECO|nr:hypothetical protein CCMSSC00406_0001067 [Pleurotus cornucopiae]
MDQTTAKQILQDLVRRDDLKNKICNDCSNPNPQWASLSFAVFLCLQCAGTHRGFGVHISFVRSISMDTWQEDKIKRMQLGGNGPFREFMKSYAPADEGGYREGMSPHDTYHCWAATQYREKLDATLAGKPWSPSPPSESTKSPNGSASPGRPSSAQGLRKSRASARSATGSTLRGDSPSSPAGFNSNSPDRTGTPVDQKTANESYFASLGQANAVRPADLPPSQGGRYQGFGSTPSPAGTQHPSYGLSSAAAPTLNEFQENPMAALSKGWSLFSAAVSGASRVVSENVIQPGMEKVADPSLRANLGGYMTEAQKRAAALGSSANQWSKSQFGIDVADSVGNAVGTVRDRVGGGPQRNGYGQLATDHDGETSALYHDDDDLFNEYNSSPSTQYTGFNNGQQINSNTAAASTTKAKEVKKDNWEDDWKDF